MAKSKNDTKVGRKHNDLGKKYEVLTEEALCDPAVHKRYNNGEKPKDHPEAAAHDLFRRKGIKKVFKAENVLVPTRDNGSQAKTDRCVLVNDVHYIKVSVKQSGSSQVAAAEISVDTINKEAFGGKMKEDYLQCMLMFQEVGNQTLLASSGKIKSFKEDLKEDYDFRGRLLRYVLSGSSSENSDDIRVADYIVEYAVDANGTAKSKSVKTVAEKLDLIIGKGTFGTGLSWTYATGTKGEKIQFKVPCAKAA